MNNNTNNLLGSLALMFLLPFNSQAKDETNTSSELSVDDETVKLVLKVNKELIEQDLVEAKKLSEFNLENITAYQNQLEYYFQEYLPVTKNEGETVPLSIKSATVEGESLVFNLEAPLEDANSLSINNRVLFDSYNDQVNKLRVSDHQFTFTNVVDEPLTVWQRSAIA